MEYLLNDSEKVAVIFCKGGIFHDGFGHDKIL